MVLYERECSTLIVSDILNKLVDYNVTQFSFFNMTLLLRHLYSASRRVSYVHRRKLHAQGKHSLSLQMLWDYRSDLNYTAICAVLDSITTSSNKTGATILFVSMVISGKSGDCSFLCLVSKILELPLLKL